VAAIPETLAGDLMAVRAIVPKLSLPAGLPILERMTASPLRFALAASLAGRCQAGVADYLLDPVRFKAALDPAAGTDLSTALELLAGYNYQYDNDAGWSLWGQSDRTRAVVDALVTATNAGWRAAAVFSLGLRADAKDKLEVLAKAARDDDPWVRGSATRALAKSAGNRAALEPLLAPLLADTNTSVARLAALALLEPETRTAAQLDSDFDYFEFESVRGGRSESVTQNDQRPLAVLDRQPVFLAAARSRIAGAPGETAAPFALLLAQYGDFSGIDQLASAAAGANPAGDDETFYPLLTGIALSHDAKYLPALKQIVAAKRDEPALRKVLQAIKGMSGPEARQLRLEINKKIRSAAGSSADSE